MKKFYTLFLALSGALCAAAQSPATYVLDPASDDIKPVVNAFSDNVIIDDDCIVKPVRKAAPAKATEYQNFTLEDNQYIIGSFTDDNYYSFTKVPYAGPTLAGAMISGSRYEKLRNCRALGIRFCLPEDWDDGSGTLQPVDLPEVTAVTLHSSDVDVIIKETTPRTVNKGWNYVKFKTPQELDPIGVFISYTYTQTNSANCYGICFWGEAVANGSWTRIINPSTGKPMWSNVSSQIGAICIQLIVEADPLPDYDIVPSAVETEPMAAGLEGQCALYVTSNSQKQIESFEYTVELGESSYTRTAELNRPIPSGTDQQAGFYVTLPAQETYGKYDGKITISKVNGEALDPATSITFKQDVYTRLAQRRSVVEEFTGTGCGNCPRGWAGMEYLKENYPENCIGIAVHQYNNSDPMYCGRYGGLGLSAAPACKIDRKVTADPYYGIDNTGIHHAVEYYSSLAPAVDVQVNGTFNEEMTKVTCNADVEFLTDTGKYTIAYVLTADGLTGKGAWLQQNYYASNGASMSAVLPEISSFADFLQGGSKGKAAVELVYNDAMIGSSYSTSGSNLAKALGSSKHTAGEVVNHSYTCSISVGDACKAALDYDQIYVVALVLDTNGQIANAARAKVSTLDGINTVLAPTTQSSEAYDLSGRRIAAPQHGVNIVGGKKVLK